MADKKISELDAVGTSADTDLVPVVQSGTTKRATLAQLLGVTHQHAAGDVDSGQFADARISESSVTQHGTAALEVPWSNTVVVEGDNSTRTTRATEVQAAITEAAGAGKSFVFVPHSFLNYDASAVTFDNSVRMVREGQVGGVYDVKAYGAAGDFSTDDQPAIQAAINEASATLDGATGGTVYLPKGRYGIDSRLEMRNRVRLLGDNLRNTLIRAGSSWSGTEMILAANAGSSMFDAFIENMEIDADGKAGLTCVVSDAMQENSGLRRVLLDGFTNIGLHVRSNDGGAASLRLQDVQIFSADDAGVAAGIQIDASSVSGSFKLHIEGVTVTGGATNQLPVGIDNKGESLFAHNCHFEQCDLGVRVDGVGHVSLVTVSGSAVGAVTSVVEVLGTFTGTLHASSVFRNSATNSIDNKANGDTLTGDVASYMYPEVVAQNTAKAWVVFNGADGSILNSYGVSGVTRSGVGDYQISFADAFPDTNYAVFAHHDSSGNDRIALVREINKQAGAYAFDTLEWTGASGVNATQIDPAQVYVVAYASAVDIS